MGFPVTFPWRLFTAATVNGTAAVTSDVLDFRKIERLENLELTMTSTGNAHDVKIQLLTSPDGVTFTNATDTPLLTASTATDFPNSATSAIVLPLPSPVARFGKFVVTGVGANPADTALTAIVHAREQ